MPNGRGPRARVVDGDGYGWAGEVAKKVSVGPGGQPVITQEWVNPKDLAYQRQPTGNVSGARRERSGRLLRHQEVRDAKATQR